MNESFDRILAADDETRAGLFTTTAQRLGTTPQNAEKDFWVCWTLDALFNGLPDGPSSFCTAFAAGSTSGGNCAAAVTEFRATITTFTP